MVITINKAASKEQVEKVLSKLKSRKKFNAKRHLGKLLFPLDGLAFQKKVRNDW